MPLGAEELVAFREIASLLASLLLTALRPGLALVNLVRNVGKPFDRGGCCKV